MISSTPLPSPCVPSLGALNSSGLGWGAALGLCDIPRFVWPGQPRAWGGLICLVWWWWVWNTSLHITERERGELEQPPVLGLGSCWFSWGRLCRAAPQEGWEWLQDAEFGVSRAPGQHKEHTASIRTVLSRQGVNGREELGMPWKPFQWRTGILAKLGSPLVVFAALQPSPSHLSPKQNEKVCPLVGQKQLSCSDVWVAFLRKKKEENLFLYDLNQNLQLVIDS